jgi:hypothetical protein
MDEHFMLSFAWKGRQYSLETELSMQDDVHRYQVRVTGEDLLVQFDEVLDLPRDAAFSQQQLYRKLLETVTGKLEAIHNKAAGAVPVV